MFSKEERLKAVKLFLKYDHSYAVVIHELGYPSVGALRHWYQEYKNTGKLKEKQNRKSKYSTDQKQKAVNHYFKHGKCYARTIRILGYPDKETLRKWCVATRPETNKICQSTVKLTEKQKPDLFTKICKIPIKHMHHAFDGYFAFSPFKCTKRASALV